MRKWIGVLGVLAMAMCLAASGYGAGLLVLPDSPDGTVKALADGIVRGQPGVFWKAMPHKYQEDVKGLVSDFAGRMDAQLYDKGFAVVKKAVAVLKKQKKFILGSPMMANVKVDPKAIDAKWDGAVAALEAVTTSDLSSIAKLKTLDIGAALDSTGGKLMTTMSGLSTLMPGDEYNKEFIAKLQGLQVQVLEKTADTATIRMTAPGEDPEEEEMVRVEGRWVPKEMAEEWDEGIAEAKKGLAEMTPEVFAQAKPQAMMMMSMVDTLLDQLLAANSQQAFDMVIGQAMMMVMGAAAGGGPPGAGPAPMPPPGK